MQVQLQGYNFIPTKSDLAKMMGTKTELQQAYDLLWAAFLGTYTNGESDQISVGYLRDLYPIFGNTTWLYLQVNNTLRNTEPGGDGEEAVVRFLQQVSKDALGAPKLPWSGWGEKRYDINCPLHLREFAHVSDGVAFLHQFFPYLDRTRNAIPRGLWGDRDGEILANEQYRALMGTLGDFVCANERS